MTPASPRIMYLDRFVRSGYPFHIDIGMLGESAFPRHTHHAFVELVLFLGGDAIHVTGAERYAVAAGDVFVVQGNRDHGFVDARNMHFVNIMYDPAGILLPERLLRALPGYHALFVIEPQYRARHQFRSRLSLDRDDLARACALCESLRDAERDALPGWEALTTALLTELFVLLSRAYGGASAAAGQVLRLANTLSLMETGFREPFDLATLAEAAHLSVNQFLRVFRQAVGMTPLQYLIRRRVEHARALLDNPDLPIQQIAAMAGFSDSNYFTRQFRRVTGQSPSAWRGQRELR